MKERAAAAEKTAENGRNKELYGKTKVKDKQEVRKTESQERLQRWVNHLSEILNRDDPTNPIEGDKIEEQEEIK